MNDGIILLGMLKIAYAQKRGINTDEDYEEELDKVLPFNWKNISVDNKIKILDEAIKNDVLASKTEAYKATIDPNADY